MATSVNLFNYTQVTKLQTEITTYFEKIDPSQQKQYFMNNLLKCFEILNKINLNIENYPYESQIYNIQLITQVLDKLKKFNNFYQDEKSLMLKININYDLYLPVYQLLGLILGIDIFGERIANLFKLQSDQYYIRQYFQLNQKHALAYNNTINEYASAFIILKTHFIKNAKSKKSKEDMENQCIQNYNKIITYQFSI